LLGQYRNAGIDHSDIHDMQLLPLGEHSTDVTVRWVSRGSDDTVIWDYRDSYWWIWSEGQWKIII
jgi:hypothetical protein